MAQEKVEVPITGKIVSIDVKVGDTVDVYLERIENAQGEAGMSRDKARREEAWEKLEQAFAGAQRVEGVIFGRVKGGFTVDLSGAVAFLPGSQVDVRPVRDINPLMGTPQPFQILKMDRRRGNIVVSRRAVLEESRAEARSELVANLREANDKGDNCSIIIHLVREAGQHGIPIRELPPNSPSPLIKQYHVLTIPTLLVLHHGRVVSRYEGESQSTVQQIRARLAKLEEARS